MEGKQIVYALGGNPQGYKLKKDYWEDSVVEWIPLENISGFSHKEDSSSYTSQHEAYISGLSGINAIELLEADWYEQLWQRVAKCDPPSGLKASLYMINWLKQLVQSQKTIEDLDQLLFQISQSYWFRKEEKAVDPFEILRLKPDDLEETSLWIRPSGRAFKGLNESYWDPHRELLLRNSRLRNAVALDIEANDREVFQIACCWANGASDDHEAGGLAPGRIQGVLDSANQQMPGSCWTGHNILNRDLRRLRQIGASLSEETPIWDTLLMGWVLEPWKRRHALVVGDGAHQAGSDASATLELFRKQAEHFAPFVEGIVCNMDWVLEGLLNNLDQGGLGLPPVEYPSSPEFHGDKTLLIAQGDLTEYLWRPHVTLLDPVGGLDTRDPVLQPSLCSDLARGTGDIFPTLLAIVVRQAQANGVEVRLSMIPKYILEDASRSTLRALHMSSPRPALEDAGNPINVCIVDDMEWVEFLQRLSDPGFFAPRPVELLCYMAGRQCRELSIQQLERRCGKSPRPPATSALYTMKGDDGVQWLRFDPPGLGDAGQLWALLPEISYGVSANFLDTLEDLRVPAKVWIPRWREGALLKIDTDWLFISPETTNRRLYLQDLLLRVLNLIHGQESEGIWILAMRHRGEADWMLQMLTLLGYSVDHSDSPLRQLENLEKKGRNVLVTTIRDIPAVLQDAELLRLHCHVLFDELPLLDWVYLSHALQQAADDPVASQKGEWQRVAMTDAMVRGCVKNFLTSWLNAFCKGWSEALDSIGLLDSRIPTRAAALAAPNVSVRDVAYHKEDILVDERQRELYREWCISPAPSVEPACQYQDLQAVLEKNWGYSDFLPLQRPVMEAIVSTRSDILLRLPTGAGKSIVFQVPALWYGEKTKRLTVVISPLRALMKDQVENLNRVGFGDTVDYLSGGRDPLENRAVYQGMLDGRIRLVYTAPERFRLPRFTEIIERRRALDGGLQFIVMDEAHCVSEWGFEFRPDYLFAANYIRKWLKMDEIAGNPHRILALSATVTEKNREDMERELALGGPEGGGYLDLPETMPHPIQDFIILNSVEAQSSEDPAYNEKLLWLVDRIRQFDIDKSGLVVFARKRKDCFDVAEYLNATEIKPKASKQGCLAAPFHAGMNEVNKAEILEGFKHRDIHVLVCTKAFGMGMDIGHIHHCIHLTPPTFIEDYLQEVGRIGRSEKSRIDAGHKQVTADLLYSEDEISRQKELVEKSSVKPAFVRNLHQWIVANMIRPVAGQPALCLVPINLHESLPEAENEVKLNQGLFWLERMEAMQIEGRFPPSLGFVVYSYTLRNWLDRAASLARARTLARFLQTELDPLTSNETGRETDFASSSRLFTGILKGLKAGVLSLFGMKTNPQPIPGAATGNTPTANEVPLAVPVQKLLSDCDFASMDEIFLAVLDLIKDHVLSLDREIKAEQFYMESGENFDILLDRVIEDFKNDTDGGVIEVPVSQIFKEYGEWHMEMIKASIPLTDFETKQQKIEGQVKWETKRAVWCAVYLLQNAGFQIEERINRNGVNVIVRSVPSGGTPRAARQVTAWREQAFRLREDLNSNAGMEASIQLVDALRIMESNTPYRDLRHCMVFLTKAGIFHWSGEALEWNVLVRVVREDALPAFDENWDPENSSEQDPRTQLPQQYYRDMEERHALRKIRGLCMHLLCLLPDEVKRHFIDSYFLAKSKEDLQSLLAKFAGELETTASEDIQALLVEARQERFAEEFDRLNENQKRVCAMDVRQNIMVNAGPGSGKTKVLTMRCAHLIHRQGIPPSGILVLAFNRAVVSEIKERVQSLFRELGYGGYARSLNVFTFHSFALQQLPDVDKFDDEGIAEALERFATRMVNDAYAISLASNYQAVLVDEFQDMTSDFYTVVSQLVRHCKGGGMVIGDDDQDILGWIRKKGPFEAYEYFTNFRDQFKPSEENLLVNYRSATSIVNAANSNILKSKENCGFQRVKTEPMSCNRDVPGHAKTHSILTPADASGRLLDILLGSYDQHETNAILCRTNKECFAILHLLKQQQCLNQFSVRMLGQTDYSLFQLRETAILLDVCKTYDSFQFVENHVWLEIMDKVRQEGLPDFEEQLKWYQLIYDTARREHGRLRCQNLVDFLMETRSSDISRLEQRHRVSGKNAHREIIISTIHMVKGLEFDNVVVTPSFSDFGRRRQYQNIFDFVGDEMARARADEARLLYVGLTRAKNQLHLIIGPRLKAWFNHGQAFHHDGDMGSSGFQGDPKEVFLSWSARTEQVNAGLQEYIRNHVKAGDSLVFFRNEIQHNNRSVGVLSQAGNQLRRKIQNPRVKVGAVIRYRCGEHFQKNHSKYYAELHPCIKKLGWFYTITVQSC